MPYQDAAPHATSPHRGNRRAPPVPGGLVRLARDLRETTVWMGTGRVLSSRARAAPRPLSLELSPGRGPAGRRP